jgi:uncharacterized protein YjbI with pentapeptide repeats
MKIRISVLLSFLLLSNIILNVSISLPSDSLQPVLSTNKKDLYDKFNFTPIEIKAWEEIIKGKCADLSSYSNREKKESTNLSVSFLKKLLFDKRLQQFLPHKGICISNAYFPEELDLEDGIINHQLSLKKCEFLKNINMEGIISDHGISFVESTINGSLFLSGAKIGGQLELDKLSFRYIEAENIKVIGPMTMEGANNKLTIGADNNPGIDTDAIKLSASIIEGQLKFDNSNFFGSVIMPGIHVSSQLSMKQTFFHGSLHLSGAILKRQLTMRNAKIFGSAKLTGIDLKSRLVMNEASILEGLNLSGSKIEGKLEMNRAIIHGQTIIESASVYGDLAIINSVIDYLDVSKADIKGQILIEHNSVIKTMKTYNLTAKNVIRITESICQGELHLNHSKIGSTLDLRKSQFFEEVLMIGANIEGDVLFDDANFDHNLDMSGTKIGGKVSFKRGTFSEDNKIDFLDIKYLEYKGGVKKIKMIGANIEGDVLFDDANFYPILDMTRSKIGGTVFFKNGNFVKGINIELAQIKSVEYKGAKINKTMDLTGTNINKIIVAIQDINDLPEKLKLHGFTYNLFILDYKGEKKDEDKFFQLWLRKMEKYKPQPYKKCAEFLREAGMPDRADQVLIKGRDRQRKEALDERKYSLWFGLSILKYSIGYGIGKSTFRALYWILLFTLIGTLFCMRPKAKKQLEIEGYISFSDYFIYSLDMLLPLIVLRKKNENIELPRLQRIYFYFHKVAGWVLLSFVLASLAGITQV